MNPNPRPTSPATAGSISTLKQARKTAANVRTPSPSRPALPGITGAAASELQFVDELQLAQALPATPRRRRVQRAGPAPAIAGVALDKQHRGTAKKILKEVGFANGVELNTFVDTARGVVWVQRGGSLPGTAPPALPGSVVQAKDQAAVTPKWELQLTPGLCSALEVGPEDQVSVLAIPALHALMLASPWLLLEACAAAPGTWTPSRELESLERSAVEAPA